MSFPRVIVPWLTVRKVPVEITVVRRKLASDDMQYAHIPRIAVSESSDPEVQARDAARLDRQNWPWKYYGVSCFRYYIVSCLVPLSTTLDPHINIGKVRRRIAIT